MAKRKSKDVYLMPEPNWAGIHKAKTDEERDKLYKHYEYFVHYEVADKKTAISVKAWLEKDSGLDKELVKKLKKVPDVWFSCFAKHTFIWHKTGYMADNVREYLLREIPKLQDKAEEIIEKQQEKKSTKPAISIQQRMREQVGDLCGKWENYIDELLWGDFDLKKFDPYREMQSYAEGVVKPAHAKIIKDMYERQYKEAEEIIAWKDEEIKEAFSYMTAKLRKQYLDFFEKINTACDTMISTGKAQRKTRKPKAVSKEKLIAKLKYKVNDSQLGIASINPADVIDAAEVWIYNTKTRKIGVYKVGGLSTGFTVKGTTLQDFDASKSVQKTLRKPAEQLKAFKGNARTKYAKAFDEIKTTDTKLTGRFNDDTVILKAF